MTWIKSLRAHYLILIMKNKIITLYLHYRSFILYGIIGCVSAGLDFFLYTALHFANIPYLVANILSTHCGILCSFALNRNINFKVKDKTVLRFASFYAIGLSGLALSSTMLYLMIDVIGWKHVVIAKIITIVVVAVLQFSLNSVITFRRTEEL